MPGSFTITFCTWCYLLEKLLILYSFTLDYFFQTSYWRVQILKQNVKYSICSTAKGIHCKVPLRTYSRLESQQFNYHLLRLFDLSLLGIFPGYFLLVGKASGRSQDQERNTIISASPAAMYRSGRVLGPKYQSDIRCSQTTRNTAEGVGDKESRACELTIPDQKSRSLYSSTSTYQEAGRQGFRGRAFSSWKGLQ